MKEQLISFETAKKLLFYSSVTGLLYWINKPSKRANRVKLWDIAGWVHKNPVERRIIINGKEYKQHRLVWLLYYGCYPNKEIDHIDGDRLNNKIENLRCVTHRQNMSNQKIHRSGKGLPVGVTRHPLSKKYHARAYKDGKHNHIGLFDTIKEAENAYLQFIHYGTI